ncbi:MAG: VOC family protein [Betaproteobacteria bacterium]|nr:MAG: VOC family protein [Betaproteobacteria bacterium]
MAKLRHIAIAVPDIQATAKFYEESFGMQRVRESDVAVMLSDGTVSLAIIDSNKNVNAEKRTGLHHFGFIVEDLDDAAGKVESSGGKYYGQIRNIGDGPQSERKYRDPNGIDFDIVNAGHADRVWRVPA